MLRAGELAADQPRVEPIAGKQIAVGPGLVRALVDLPDDVATQGQSLFYLDAADALSKALNES